jgi:hypothetical protein
LALVLGDAGLTGVPQRAAALRLACAIEADRARLRACLLARLTRQLTTMNKMVPMIIFTKNTASIARQVLREVLREVHHGSMLSATGATPCG